MSRSRTVRLLCVTLLAACAGVSAKSGAQLNGGFDPNKPATPEQIREWVKKLEEPTRDRLDPKMEPPDGVAPLFDYHFHWYEIAMLKKAGEAARPAVFALLEDTTKPGQARAHAAVILIDWLWGKGAKQEVDAKILAALKEALKDKNRALKWGIVQWLPRYGGGGAQAAFQHDIERWLRLCATGTTPEDLLRNFLQGMPNLDPGWRHFSDAAMDGLLPEVIALLADEEDEIATCAAITIFAFDRPKQGIKELLVTLDRRDRRLRAYAVAALSRVGRDDPAVLTAVLGQLKPQHYGTHYSTVVRAVGRFGPKAKAAVPELIRVVESSGWKFQYDTLLYDEAIVALGEIGPDAKAATPAILKYADSVRVLPDLLTALDKIDPKAGQEARAVQKRKEDEFIKMLEKLPKP